jgi:hypothetical protein
MKNGVISVKRKCSLLWERLNYWEVRINGKEQTPSEIKKNKALTYPEPKNIKELRRFLGLAGWFRSFIKGFSSLTNKMTCSLRVTNKGWEWNEELQKEFENLKEALRMMSFTILPDYKKEFILKTDASNVELGDVLMQEVNGKMLPVQWASKKLTSTESRYGISEKEMLATVRGKTIVYSQNFQKSQLY